MTTLFTLTISGSLVALIVVVLDRLFARTMSTQFRRLWWLLVPLAFFINIPVPILPAIATETTELPSTSIDPYVFPISPELIHQPFSISTFVPGVWLSGCVVFLAIVAIRTARTHWFWSHQRLCTDSALLTLLEDCKQELGVTIPFGVVVSEDVPAPAILGWVRPRILIPRILMETMSRAELRPVLLHELAHFRASDLIWNWAFTFICAVHWFNPLAHLSQRAWRQFIEESADETALTLLKGPSEPAYGDVLLKAIRQTHARPPCGALAIGESLTQLKHRILMIKNHSNKIKRPLVAVLCTMAVIFTLIFPLSRAKAEGDPKADAVAAMKTWLGEVDDGKYGQSWTDASTFFQSKLSSDKWVAALTSVRTPLGKCTKRTLASALHQTEVPGPDGTVKGDFIVAQFDASFENLAYSVETVCFQKDSDGTWKCSGYYIKPKS